MKFHDVYQLQIRKICLFEDLLYIMAESRKSPKKSQKTGKALKKISGKPEKAKILYNRKYSRAGNFREFREYGEIREIFLHANIIRIK